MDTRTYVIAPSIEQGEITAERLGLRARIVATNLSRDLPPGACPFPEAVHYAPGWERGRNADRILAQLQRAYAKHFPPPPPTDPGISTR